MTDQKQKSDLHAIPLEIPDFAAQSGSCQAVAQRETNFGGVRGLGVGP